MDNDTLYNVNAAVITNHNFEVGIAAINLNTPSLFVNQISDNRMYDTSIAFLKRIHVESIRFPASHYNSPLLNKLENSGFNVTQVLRNLFSEDDGMDLLRMLSVEAIDVREIEPWYLARASTAALLRHVEHEQEAHFEKGSMKVHIGDFL